jgi:hypothetical protein
MFENLICHYGSQIGMIEAASELKISNQFEIGLRVFICQQLELGDGKSP